MLGLGLTLTLIKPDPDRPPAETHAGRAGVGALAGLLQAAQQPQAVSSQGGLRCHLRNYDSLK